MKKSSPYEGLQGHIRRIKTPAIEVFKNQYDDREYVIHLNIPECTCICPKTGLPDFVVLNIWYKPHKVCLELKSLKMYIISYRDVGIFHEHLTNKVLDDVVKACGPRWAKVEAAVSPRGGIQTMVAAEYTRKES